MSNLPGRRTDLTAADVKLIKAAAVERDRLKAEALLLSNASLAKKFNTSPTTISCVINNYYHYQSAEDT
jgi:hypothetical protein